MFLPLSRLKLLVPLIPKLKFLKFPIYMQPPARENVLQLGNCCFGKNAKSENGLFHFRFSQVKRTSATQAIFSRAMSPGHVAKFWAEIVLCDKA
jgi:hypothetical protein